MRNRNCENKRTIEEGKKYLRKYNRISNKMVKHGKKLMDLYFYTIFIIKFANTTQCKRYLVYKVSVKCEYSGFLYSTG